MFSVRGKCIVAGAAGVVLLAGSFGYAQPKKAEVAKPAAKPAIAAKKVVEKAPSPDVLATVNGVAITKKQLTETLLNWSAAPTLDEMVDAEMFRQAAKKEGVTVTAKELNDKLSEIKRSMPPGQDLDQMLRRKGFSMSHAMEQIKLRIMIEKSAKKSIKVNDDELTQVKASHILIRSAQPKNPDDAAEKTKNEEEAKAKAEKILVEAKAAKTAAEFGELAKKYSEDTFTKEKGGDLDYFRKGRMVPEFEAAAFSMKAGEITEKVVKSDFGFHIIRVDAVKTAKTMSPAELAKAREELVTERMPMAVQDWAAKVKASAKIKRYAYK